MVTNATTKNTEPKKEEKKIQEELKELEANILPDPVPAVAPVVEKRQNSKKYKNYSNIYSKKEEPKES